MAHQVNELVVRNGLVIEDASSQDTTIGQNTLLTLRTQVGRQRCTDGGIELAFTLSENTMSRICISIYSARRGRRQTPHSRWQSQDLGVERRANDAEVYAPVHSMPVAEGAHQVGRVFHVP